MSYIQNNPAPQDRILKGVVHVCTAFFLFTVMQAAAKLLTGRHHVIEIAFYRNIIALIPLLAYIIARRKFYLLKTKKPVAMAFRMLIGTSGLIITFAAVQALPLANATVIFFTATLLVPVFSFFFLKEQVGWHRWAAVFIGMGGVVLVAQPSAQLTALGVGLALAAAFTHAVVAVLIRHMRSENPLTITFYFILGGALVPGLLMPWFAHAPTVESLLPLLFIGVAGGLGQYFLTSGLQMAPASLLSPFNYTGLLWATGLDMLLWNYVPGWPVFAGAAIIIASNLYILHRERLKGKKTKPAAPFTA
jgi:drug/metabolite transporter (DMT)-like permease